MGARQSVEAFGQLLAMTLDAKAPDEAKIVALREANEAQRGLYAAWMGDAWERAPKGKG